MYFLYFFGQNENNKINKQRKYIKNIKKDEEFLYQNMIKTKELKEQLIKMYNED